MSKIPPPPMYARAWHCTTRLAVDAVLTRNQSQLRATVGAVLRHGAPAGLVAHCVVDTHLHALFVGDRVVVGEAMRRIELACHQLLPLTQRFEGARIRPVRDQSHLKHCVGYVLRQLDRHDIRGDRLGEGSGAHDLLGARVPGLNLADRILQELPRGDIQNLWELVGASADLASYWDDPVSGDDLTELPEATLRAFALRTLERRSRRFTRVRAAMVQAAAPSVGNSAVARATGLSRGAVINLRNKQVPSSWIKAVRRQVHLGLHAGRPLAGGPPGAPRSAARGDGLSAPTTDHPDDEQT